MAVLPTDFMLKSCLKKIGGGGIKEMHKEEKKRAACFPAHGKERGET